MADANKPGTSKQKAPSPTPSPKTEDVKTGSVEPTPAPNDVTPKAPEVPKKPKISAKEIQDDIMFLYPGIQAMLNRGPLLSTTAAKSETFRQLMRSMVSMILMEHGEDGRYINQLFDCRLSTIDAYGGHTLKKHVHVTHNEIWKRVKEDIDRETSTSSKFINERAAQYCILSALSNGCSKLRKQFLDYNNRRKKATEMMKELTAPGPGTPTRRDRYNKSIKPDRETQRELTKCQSDLAAPFHATLRCAMGEVIGYGYVRTADGVIYRRSFDHVVLRVALENDTAFIVTAYPQDPQGNHWDTTPSTMIHTNFGMAMNPVPMIFPVLYYMQEYWEQLEMTADRNPDGPVYSGWEVIRTGAEAKRELDKKAKAKEEKEKKEKEEKEAREKKEDDVKKTLESEGKGKLDDVTKLTDSEGKAKKEDDVKKPANSEEIKKDAGQKTTDAEATVKCGEETAKTAEQVAAEKPAEAAKLKEEKEVEELEKKKKAAEDVVIFTASDATDMNLMALEEVTKNYVRNHTCNVRSCAPSDDCGPPPQGSGEISDEDLSYKEPNSREMSHEAGGPSPQGRPSRQQQYRPSPRKGRSLHDRRQEPRYQAQQSQQPQFEPQPQQFQQQQQQQFLPPSNQSQGQGRHQGGPQAYGQGQFQQQQYPPPPSQPQPIPSHGQFTHQQLHQYPAQQWFNQSMPAAHHSGGMEYHLTTSGSHPSQNVLDVSYGNPQTQFSMQQHGGQILPQVAHLAQGFNNIALQQGVQGGSVDFGRHQVPGNSFGQGQGFGLPPPRPDTLLIQGQGYPAIQSPQYPMLPPHQAQAQSLPPGYYYNQQMQPQAENPYAQYTSTPTSAGWGQQHQFFMSPEHGAPQQQEQYMWPSPIYGSQTPTNRRVDTMMDSQHPSAESIGFHQPDNDVTPTGSYHGSQGGDPTSGPYWNPGYYQ